MLTLHEYYKPIDSALAEINNILGKVLFKIQDMSEDSIILSDFDWNGFIYQLERSIEQLNEKRVRYKFDKMNEHEFELMLARDSEGDITLAQDYKVKTDDTLRKVSLAFNVPELLILNYNHLSYQEYQDARERNETIKIPITIKLKEKTVYDNLAVYDSHSGKSAWGKDISNDLQCKEGRLVVLDYTETLKQSIKNLMGEYGSIPFYEEITLDLDWGRDYPKDFLEVFTKIKMERRLRAEPRVQEIVDIISVPSKEATGLNFDVIFYPINVIPNKENAINLAPNV